VVAAGCRRCPARAGLEADLDSALDVGGLELLVEPLLNSAAACGRWRQCCAGTTRPAGCCVGDQIAGLLETRTSGERCGVAGPPGRRQAANLPGDVCVLVSVGRCGPSCARLGDVATESLAAVGRDPATLILQVA